MRGLKRSLVILAFGGTVATLACDDTPICPDDMRCANHPGYPLELTGHARRKNGWHGIYQISIRLHGAVRSSFNVVHARSRNPTRNLLSGNPTAAERQEARE